MHEKINRYMGNTNYITAIELSSSKVSGAVGIEAYDGIKILAIFVIPSTIIADNPDLWVFTLAGKRSNDTAYHIRI